MTTIVHVHQHRIRANAKNGTADPPIIVRRGKQVRYGSHVEILDKFGRVFARLRYRPADPLACGARVWLETEATVTVDRSTPAIPDRRPFVQEVGSRDTDLGPALYVKVRTEDYALLTWREVWEAVAAAHPRRWGAMFMPPADQLVDDANVYHVYLFDEEPRGVNVCRR